MKRLSELLSPENTVSLFELTRYMNSVGWKERGMHRGNWRLFVKAGEDGRQLEVALPASDNLRDAGRLKIDALNVLAQLQEQELRVVASEVAGFTRDSQQFRILDVNDSDDLSLGVAQHYIKGLKNLFLYGACSEIKAKPFFEQPLPSASDNLESFRFGHTFKGSFGFTVFSRVVQQNETVDMLSEKTFPRRVNERVARGFMLLKEAVTHDNADILSESYETALNAKMCDALVEMIGEGDGRFACSFAWAADVPISDDLRFLPQYVLGNREAEVLEYASEKLKQVEPEEQALIGVVTNLHCPKNPGDASSKRVIAVKVRHPEHGTLDVYIELGARRYLAAIDAHRNGASVKVIGKLERKGSKWFMNDLRELSVIDA